MLWCDIASNIEEDRENVWGKIPIHRARDLIEITGVDGIFIFSHPPRCLTPRYRGRWEKIRSKWLSCDKLSVLLLYQSTSYITVRYASIFSAFFAKLYKISVPTWCYNIRGLSCHRVSDITRYRIVNFYLTSFILHLRPDASSVAKLARHSGKVLSGIS